MKSYAHVLAALMIIASVGCKSYSKYTIDEKPVVKTDSNLLGIWKAVEDTSKKNFILIQRFSDVYGSTTGNPHMDYRIRKAYDNRNYHYYITYWNAHGENPLFTQWTVFKSVINNELFLNIPYHYSPSLFDPSSTDNTTDNTVDGYFFVRLIKINPSYDTITIAVVADSTLRYIPNARELRNRISKNLNKPSFYSDTVHFYHISRSHTYRGAMLIANPE